MIRAAKAVASRKRRKRILAKAKGFRGSRKNHIRMTKDAVMKAEAYNYEHRKQKKRRFKSLWIMRISIASKINGLSYSKFMNGLTKMNCQLNRKMLSFIALEKPETFRSLADQAKKVLELA